MGKQPYIPLYIGDWEQDTNCLSLEAEGAWLKLVFKLWKGESNLGKGLLSISFRAMGILFKCSPEKTKEIFQELVESRVFDHEITPNGDVKITSRRLVREAKISQIRSEVGKEGGRPKKGKQTESKQKAKLKQIPEYEYDNDIEDIGKKSDHFVIVRQKYANEKNYRIYGPDGLKEFLEVTCYPPSKLTFPEYAIKFMRDKDGQHFEDLKHLKNAYADFVKRLHQ